MNTQKNEKGRVVIVSGPSGVGKSTICKGVVKQLKNAYLGVSITTRPKAEGEVDGLEYWFVSKEEFERRINDRLLLEYAEVFGNMYGTPKDKTEEALAAGKTAILEIDVQGARQARQAYPDAKMFFIFPPTQKELAERIKNRGREDTESADKRLNEAGSEIAAAWQYYEYMIINDDLEQAVNEVVQIIENDIGDE